jgi:hypothetical protein
MIGRREFITLLNAPLRHTLQGILFGARCGMFHFAD